jgi:hypothetical protein
MKAGRSCDELGVCQRKAVPCTGCSQRRHFFAPGVIEGGSAERQTRALMRWTLICAGLMAAVAVLSFAAGVLS